VFVILKQFDQCGQSDELLEFGVLGDDVLEVLRDDIEADALVLVE